MKGPDNSESQERFIPIFGDSFAELQQQAGSGSLIVVRYGIDEHNFTQHPVLNDSAFVDNTLEGRGRKIELEGPFMGFFSVQE